MSQPFLSNAIGQNPTIWPHLNCKEDLGKGAPLCALEEEEADPVQS